MPLKVTIGLLLFLVSEGLLGQNQLYIPPPLYGPVYYLEMQHGTHTFIDGKVANTMGFNGDVLGPTLFLNAGEFVELNILNSIGEETTVHWHGLHVSSEDDGGPHSIIDPNSEYDPSFTVLDKAATYWYHPHLHEYTNKHVSLGLAGMIIVSDAEEQALNLPRTYGTDDFPIILQTKSMDPETGQVRYHPASGSLHSANNDSIQMVNATVDPYLEVPQQVVRLRLLNGASHRIFELGLSNNGTFYQIASDGGLLTSPYPTTRLRLSPGERAEILVDFSAFPVGSKVDLLSFASEIPSGYWGAVNPRTISNSVPKYSLNPLNGTNFKFLEFRVFPATGFGVTSIPQTLASDTPIPESQATTTRAKWFFSGGSRGPRIGPSPINLENELFDINVVNDIVNLGETEIWELYGDTIQSHTFHIHDVQFYILDRQPINGNPSPPSANERGRKDVVLVGPGERVRFIAEFETHANDEVPYMYHCHFLPHEDRGMMGQFLVRYRHDLYVDKGHLGFEEGSINFPYDTVKEAFDNALPGTNVILKSNGDHNEVSTNLLLNKRVDFKLLNGAVIIK